MLAELFQSRRRLRGTLRWPTREFAHGMAELVAVYCPAAAKIRVVLDNLSPHTQAALYEVFPPADACQLLRTLESHLTPMRGSWLNVAETELAVLARRCLNRWSANSLDFPV